MSKRLSRRAEEHLLHKKPGSGRSSQGVSVKRNVYLEDEITKCKMNCLYYI